MQSDDPLAELVALLGRLPGIGERTATRLAYFVLAEDATYARAVAGSLAALHERVRRCASCGNFTSSERCRICTDPTAPHCASSRASRISSRSSARAATAGATTCSTRCSRPWTG
jgi:recombination protein RecR